jgi:hypothetical protein
LSERDLANYWQKFLALVEEQEKPLCGVISQGNLIHIDPARQYWRVRFTQKFHRERMDREIKSGRFQPLVEAVMGAPYQLQTELQGSALATANAPSPPPAQVMSGALPPAPAQMTPAALPPPPPAPASALPQVDPRPLPPEPKPLPETPQPVAPLEIIRAQEAPPAAPTSVSNKALTDAAELFKGKIIRTSS